MQPDFLQYSSWSSFSNRNSSLDEFDDYGLFMDSTVDHYEFSPFTVSDDSNNSIISIFPSTSPDQFMKLPVLAETDFSIALDDFVIEDMPEPLEESEKSCPSQWLSMDGEDGWSLSSPVNSSDKSMDMSLIHASLTLPTEDMELGNELRLVHLVKAYGEAVDTEQRELAKVIAERIRERVSPVGGVMERLLCYLFQPLDKQACYLKQESGKNFRAAFKAFYEIFPYGKFAHFAANLEILKALPHDVEVIHIIDFDMGAGIQWSSMIEAIRGQQREIKLTSIKWSEGDYNCDPTRWRFEETKRWLCDHARTFGLKLTVDSMKLHDLVSKIKKMKKNGGRRTWLAFNCMVGLPHMGMVRSRKDVSEFLEAAKELLAYTAIFGCHNTGIITLGDGDTWEESNSYSSFGSFLDGHLVHCQALLESMEWTFPIRLGEARTALECLFVAPLVSSIARIRKQAETKCFDVQLGFGLEGWQVCKESLVEAKEMVRAGENLYELKIEGLEYAIVCSSVWLHSTILTNEWGFDADSIAEDYLETRRRRYARVVDKL
ncbi:protein NODULATION SIGNALING PATHWAY 2-like [Actinidia eriantha]|uniref:protein NODULATION SIGNALING PATHWAY 2-like n=1 Tax=Actinidia eriantha TaxID=165200 RepID=UPI00258F9398|nr:protein NODULATION SIGNALING PATHWAY 2-like [Actinidia eriantha]